MFSFDFGTWLNATWITHLVYMKPLPRITHSGHYDGFSHVADGLVGLVSRGPVHVLPQSCLDSGDLTVPSHLLLTCSLSPGPI